MDIFERLRNVKGPLGQYQDMGHGYFLFPILEGQLGPRMKFRGKEVLTWSLNNYLGLGNLPEVRKADSDATDEWGLAYPMGARMMSGQTTRHQELEQKLADFVGKESGYLLNYGYQGMVSIIDSLVTRNDVIVYDSDSHACILDGLRLHMGKRYVYPHNNMEKFEKCLERATALANKQGGGILVITEGVFGMIGDLGNLKDMVELKKKYNFRLLIDDAHGFGTMGKTGAGTGEHYGVQDGIDIYFGTFAKSMAGIGAFVAAEKAVIDFLTYNMRSQVFAKSLPMPMVMGALKRLELLQTRPELREKVWEIANALQDGLKKSGFDIGITESPVTPIFIKGGVSEAANMLVDLRENYNIFCSIVVYPVVPKGVIMFRLIPTADHSLEDVDITLKVFAEVYKKLTAGVYQNDDILNRLA